MLQVIADCEAELTRGAIVIAEGDGYRVRKPDRLQVRDDLVALDTLMLGNGAKDRTERAKPEWMVVWNRDPVVWAERFPE